MSRVRKNEKMQMVRLAATIQTLHDDATNPALGEELGRDRAAQLGGVVLRHIDLIIAALREAGRK